ncbi:hypothetical protein [Halorubrum amylolyticum]|uniref:hypothetical protein n=1 Tax=Halorubrum amylolyticum TaxID=2508724 RepID=UPI001F50F4C5|nr:hypothetical protein [Halorubrum amylolyticum]
MTARSTEEPDASPRDVSDDTPAMLAGSRVASAVRAVSDRVGLWVRTSALFQWLTAEPDPEVIVIDLRETWTVGPFLRILDWMIERLVDSAADSRAVDIAQRGATATFAAPLRAAGLGVATLGAAVAISSLFGGVSTVRLVVGLGLAVGGLLAMQDTRDWATLRETRPVTLAIAALEPPAPPNTDSDDTNGQPPADSGENSTRSMADDADDSNFPSSDSLKATEASDSDDC